MKRRIRRKLLCKPEATTRVIHLPSTATILGVAYVDDLFLLMYHDLDQPDYAIGDDHWFSIVPHGGAVDPEFLRGTFQGMFQTFKGEYYVFHRRLTETVQQPETNPRT